jgi:hypothetical protein
MARPYFSVGSNITWKQYHTKRDVLSVVRTGAVWADAPAFPGGGSYVWVIPDAGYEHEKPAIAVRVHRGGDKRGAAEVFEDSVAYHESLKVFT